MKISLCSDIINEEDISLLIEWLKTCPKLTKGSETVRFENAFSKYIDIKHSIFCNSGSSANLLIVSALNQMGLLSSKKVIVPQVSWSTTIFPVIQFGLEPILCDCNLENLGIDLEHLESILKEHQPSALILVHVLGFDSNIEEVIKLCNKYNVLVIEDTCESLGSKTSNKMLGSFGFASSFSFYFGHHISTIEGGMVATDNDDFADVIKMIRSHGWDRDLNKKSQNKYRDKYNVNKFDSLYKFYYAGFNLRSTDLQAFIGINQKPKMADKVEKRERNYHLYKDNIKEGLWKPRLCKNQQSVSNMGYPILIKNKREIYEELSYNNIECRPLVAGSMGTQPVWSDLYGETRMKNSDIIEQYGMYVPNHQDLNEQDILRICSILNKGVAI